MAKNSKIEWTTHTFNPWRGCTKVSEGCRNCYADAMSHRNPSVLGVWGPNGTRVVAAEAAWKEPLKWDREAKAAGERHRVFCASLADVFEGIGTMPAASYDAVMQARKRLGQLILDTSNLDWLLLTKRPQNILPIAADMWVRFSGPSQPFPPNVWIGTSVENQQAADERIPHLLKVPASVRFLSCEPLLGPVNLRQWLDAEECEFCGPDFVHVDVEESYTIVATGETRTGIQTYCDECSQRDPESGSTVNGVDSPIHWVIVGGESGPNARPMHPDWARSLRDQCRQASGVAFHFKRHGEYVEWNGTQSPSPSCRSSDGKIAYVRVGKEKAGRVLDGCTWDEVPSVGGAS